MKKIKLIIKNTYLFIHWIYMVVTAIPYCVLTWYNKRAISETMRIVNERQRELAKEDWW